MHGYGRIPGEVVERGLRFLEEQEFNEVVHDIDRLRAIGIIRGVYTMHPTNWSKSSNHMNLYKS
ncbi:MAG: hypothetical protein QXE10_07320 [Desulfurococcaceae archaeon]